jgi:hypothetical protein
MATGLRQCGIQIHMCVVLLSILFRSTPLIRPVSVDTFLNTCGNNTFDTLVGAYNSLV